MLLTAFFNMRPLPFLFFFIATFSLQAQKQIANYNLKALDSLYKQQDSPQDKLPYALAMINRADQEGQQQDSSYAIILTKVGYAFGDLQRFEKATLYLQKAIAIQKSACPTSNIYSQNLSDLGTFYFHQGQLKKTKKAWLRCLKARKETLGEQSPKYGDILGNLALLYMEMGHYNKAEQFHLKSLAVIKTTLGEQDLKYAFALGNLATLYKKMGDYAKAESFYQQALAIETKTVGKKHPDYAITLKNLGILYKEKGEDPKAMNYYQEALAIEKEILGEQHPNYINTLGNVANLYKKMGDYAKAEENYLQTLHLTQKNIGTNHPKYALTLNNLGAFYQDMNDYSQAEKYYKQALKLRKAMLGQKHPHYISTLSNLGRLFTEQQDTAQAWKYIRASIHANTDLWVSRHIQPIWVDSLLATSYITLQRMNYDLSSIYDLLEIHKNPSIQKQQAYICDLAIQLLARNKNKLSDEADKLRILEENAKWVLLALQVLDKEKDKTQIINIVEQNKSVLLLDAMRTQEAYLDGLLPDSLVKEEKQLQKQYSKAKAALVEKRPEEERDSIQNQLNHINLKLDAFKRQVIQDYPKYANLKYHHPAIQAKEIQSLLDKKTALLEYLVTPSSTYVFYIDKTTIEIHEIPIPKQQLKSRIKKLHHALSDYSFIQTQPNDAYSQYTKQAHWFYQQLLAPLLKDKTNNQKLLIVTDDELGHLPFETFLVESAPQTPSLYNTLHYLLKDYSISYNYSATLWKANKETKSQKNNGQIFGVAADYTIPVDTTLRWRLPSDLSIREQLRPLPAAIREVEHLQENFKGYFVFDKNASEKNFKAKASSYAVIHLAMHGLLSPIDPMLSSLAFTEDQDSLENNFLHAYEISKMDLNTDLVVLSACETGYGRFERGNGIASLARAFMYAGAPSLIVSLWQVNDETTAQIMQGFYQNLSKSMPVDEALRQAKLSYIQTQEGVRAHPALWSPFIQIGKTQAIAIHKKNNRVYWWLGGGFLCLLGIAFFSFRNRYS